MKRIIIFKDFERDYIYDASSEHQLLEAFLATFKRRWSSFNSYYFSAPVLTSFTETEIECLRMTDEEIAQLPTGIRNVLVDSRNSLKARRASNRRAEAEHEFWHGEAEKLLGLDDKELQINHLTTLYRGTNREIAKPTVIWLLAQRNHLQGERFEIVQLDT